MNKKQLAILLLLLFFLFFFYLIVKKDDIKYQSDIPKKTTETIMPKFIFRTLNDAEFTQENLFHKDVVFYFFSPGCGECNKMSKKICELSNSFPEYKFLMVSNEPKGVILKYFDTLPFKYITGLIDEQNFSTNTFSITSIPTTMIYKNGILKSSIVGNVKLSFLKEKILN